MADEEIVEAENAPKQKANTLTEYPEMTFRNFLEQTPPDTHVRIIDLEPTPTNSNYLVPPDILLFCETPDCSGPRMFRASDSLFFTTDWNFSLLKYQCRNCGRRQSWFRKFRQGFKWRLCSPAA